MGAYSAPGAPERAVPEAIPVQCTLLVKSDQNNWLVSLHQGLSIPVAGHVDSPGCQVWSEPSENVVAGRDLAQN